jgi:hypothetical protein
MSGSGSVVGVASGVAVGSAEGAAEGVSAGAVSKTLPADSTSVFVCSSELPFPEVRQ